MGPRAGLELGEQVPDVGLDRLLRQVEPLADLPVHEPVRDQLEHLDLAAGRLLLHLGARPRPRTDESGRGSGRGSPAVLQRPRPEYRPPHRPPLGVPPPNQGIRAPRRSAASASATSSWRWHSTSTGPDGRSRGSSGSNQSTSRAPFSAAIRFTPVQNGSAGSADRARSSSPASSAPLAPP